jgi:REP element-mobilizing transposase RayT
MRYLITFACYGARLHGAESGSVDRNHNLPGSRYLTPDQNRSAAERRIMQQEPYLLDRNGGAAVLAALQEVCLHRRWTLLAAHVRTTHVHVVVEAEARPERVMNAFKAYASRRLNVSGHITDRNRWARHGSTRWLWNDRDVREAIRYVLEEQGEPMATFLADGLLP